MANKITNIRLSVKDSTSTEHITDVKLSTGAEQKVAAVVSAIDSGTGYYYTNAAGSSADVITVKPLGRTAYIKTKADSTTKDNLLSLPKF